MVDINAGIDYSDYYCVASRCRIPCLFRCHTSRKASSTGVL